MENNMKQIKITKLFRKGAKLPKDKQEVNDEYQQLEQILQEKRNELFQIQRQIRKNNKSSLLESNEGLTFSTKSVVLMNSEETLKQQMELMSMLNGMEVQSYKDNEYCCVVFHMQHDTDHIVKCGLRIDMTTDGNEITNTSLPVGFNLNGVLGEYESVMSPECLRAIRKGLVAYYSRLEQFEALKKLLTIESEMFTTLDGSHMEISFYIENTIDDEAEEFNITLVLEYRVYDIRPKAFSFKDTDLPEEALEILKLQCGTFKKKPLRKAFKEAFLDDIGTYRLVRQLGSQNAEEAKNQKFRRNKQKYNNDDTFHPDHCSDQGEDDI